MHFNFSLHLLLWYKHFYPQSQENLSIAIENPWTLKNVGIYDIKENLHSGMNKINFCPKIIYVIIFKKTVYW